MSKLKSAIIGYGYWGKILERNLLSRTDISLEVIVEQDTEALKLLKHTKLESGINFTSDINECVGVDVAFVAVPPKMHFDVTKFLLNNDIDVWVEKPFAHCKEEAVNLLSIASKNNRLVYVDFPFLYDNGFKKIADFEKQKCFGELTHYQSRRMNLGIVQAETDILHDLFVHDLSIVFGCGALGPMQGSYHMMTPGIGFSKQHNNPIAQIIAKSKGQKPVTVNTTLGWVSHGKIRDHIFFFEKATIGWEPFNRESPVSISESYIEWEDLGEQFLRAQYRKGQIVFPPIEESDPLQGAISDFLSCVENGKKVHYSTEIALLAHETNENLVNCVFPNS